VISPYNKNILEQIYQIKILKANSEIKAVVYNWPRLPESRKELTVKHTKSSKMSRKILTR